MPQKGDDLTTSIIGSLFEIAGLPAPPPNYAESSFLEFLESRSSYVSPSRIVYDFKGGKPEETLYDMWRGAGSPYLTNYSAEELLAQDKARGITTYHDRPRAFFSPGRRTLWDVLGLWEKGREVSPDTLHIQKGDMHELFAELAHAEQYKSEWDFGPGSREYRSGMAHQKHGEKVYYSEYLEDLEPARPVETSYYTGRAFPKSKTKSIEYEAHQEIQPKLERRFRESFSKRHRDLESAWEE